MLKVFSRGSYGIENDDLKVRLEGVHFEDIYVDLMEAFWWKTMFLLYNHPRRAPVTLIIIRAL